MTARVWCALALSAGLAWNAQGASVRELDKKLKSHQKNLEKLREQIRDLETEKGKLKREEENLLRALKKIDSDIARSVKKQVRLNRQLREAEAQIRRMEKNVSAYSDESLKWEESVMTDLSAYYVKAVHAAPLRADPMAGQAMRAALALKYGSMKSAEDKKLYSMNKQREFLRSKERLAALQSQLAEETQKQKESQSEKNELLKTTLGKRVNAEQQAGQLRETADSLEQLMSQLRRRKEKTLTARREAEALKKSFQDKQKLLPWPVEGTVVSPYGKHKHPELNITVFNNGVRLRVTPSAPIKCVESGTVIYSADFRSYGQTVIVDHGGDTYSIYGLLGSIAVKEGEKAAAGKVLGLAADDGHPQLYFEIRVEGRSENPLSWLK